jgi:hypothetical protein
MTAVEVRSMTQPPYAPLSTGRLPCVPCLRPWGIVAEPPRDRLPRLGIGHPCTRAYRPQTNGKAERFIRTMLSGRAYGAT